MLVSTTRKRWLAVAATGLLLLLVALSLTVSSQAALARSADFPSGTYLGQGTYNDGQPSFQVIFHVTVQNGQVTGTWEVPDYGDSIVAISGTQTPGKDIISFTDNAAIRGNGIQLNCNYVLALLNSTTGEADGAWAYPGHDQADGSLQLWLTG